MYTYIFAIYIYTYTYIYIYIYTIYIYKYSIQFIYQILHISCLVRSSYHPYPVCVQERPRVLAAANYSFQAGSSWSWCSIHRHRLKSHGRNINLENMNWNLYPFLALCPWKVWTATCWIIYRLRPSRRLFLGCAALPPPAPHQSQHQQRHQHQ